MDADIELRTLKNWARWESEKPLWFDENFKASVPDEFIPKTALDDLNRKSVGGMRRRSSAGLLLIQADDQNAEENN